MFRILWLLDFGLLKGALVILNGLYVHLFGDCCRLPVVSTKYYIGCVQWEAFPTTISHLLHALLLEPPHVVVFLQGTGYICS